LLLAIAQLTLAPLGVVQLIAVGFGPLTWVLITGAMPATAVSIALYRFGPDPALRQDDRKR
jgi:hypothetical protein